MNSNLLMAEEAAIHLVIDEPIPAVGADPFVPAVYMLVTKEVYHNIPLWHRLCLFL